MNSRHVKAIFWLMALAGGQWVYDLKDGLRRVQLWGYEWVREGAVAYAQGPGLSYRNIGDVVATRITRHVRYHRVGEIAYTSVCGLVVYRRVAGIRSFRPTFRVF